MPRFSPRLLLAFAVSLIVYCVFYFNMKYDNYKTSVILMQQTDPNLINFPKRRFDKFIFHSYVGGCVGLGNQMFRIASLYGIGRYPNVNRTPGLNGPKKCLENYMKEFSETFPNVMKLVEFDLFHRKNATKSKFGIKAYENPETLQNVDDKYLVINGGYLHAFRYFNYVMDDIRQLFDFHPKIKAQVEQYGAKLFKSDMSHKMCVHIRRTDFVKHRLLETKEEFLIPEMSIVRNFLSQKYSDKNISLIFITDDEKFVDSLKFPKDDYLNIYRPKVSSRGGIIHFGAKYCNSLLISASGSTFASWIGLLMSEGSDIFFNQQAFKNISKSTGKGYVNCERYPKHWNVVEFNEEDGTVFIDNMWYLERCNKS